MSTINSLVSLLDDLRSESFRNQEPYNNVCEKLAKLTKAESSSIFILKPEINRLVMRGDYGYKKTFVNCEETDCTYEPGEGVTGTVFETGMPNKASTAEEVRNAPGHKSKLYEAQWKGEHVCHSWFQFPIKDMNDRPIAVMKIENKLDDSRKPKPKESGGFEDDETKMLVIVANLIVPFIWVNQTRDTVVQIERTSNIGHTSDIYGIFTRDIIAQLEKTLATPDSITENIAKFCADVKANENTLFDYVGLVSNCIKDIAGAFGISDETMKYCELLNEYEPVLHQIASYRGHYVHQFNVFLNGYVILKNLDQECLSIFFDGFIGKNDHFSAYPADKKLDELLKAWFIIALFHDIGYPISKIEGWTGSFISRFLYGNKESEAGKAAAKDLAEKLAVNLRSEILHDLIEMSKESCLWLGMDETELFCHIHELFFEKLNENVVPGIVLKRAFKGDDANQWLIGAAVSAIFLDDEDTQGFVMDKMQEKFFPWRLHPLAFLLAMCDAAQEIGRGRLKDDAVVTGDDAVVDQTLEVSGKRVRWELIYQNKPAIWATVIKPQIDHIQEFWQTDSDLQVSIDYMLGRKRLGNILIGNEK